MPEATRIVMLENFLCAAKYSGSCLLLVVDVLPKQGIYMSLIAFRMGLLKPLQNSAVESERNGGFTGH